VTTLEHYAEINPAPGSLERTSTEQVAFVPMAAVSEEGRLESHEIRRLAEVAKGYTYFERGDVLMAKITPCMENGKAALLDNLVTRRGFGSTEFHVLRPRPGVDARFLFYLIWNQRFRMEAAKHMTGSAGQKRVPASYLKQAKLPLVDPNEQRRIADILDKADAIRRKRNEAVALTEELLRSAFLNMVGPGARDYAQWPVRTIESFAAQKPNSMRTGPFGSDLLHSEFVDEGIAVLGIDNAVQNRFAWSERRFITREKYERLRRYTVFPNDVIVTIMGTTGRSAVVPDDIPTAITTKHLATITLDRDQAEPEFVSQALFRHPEVLRQIAAANRGAIMSGLNLGLIKALRIPIPPPTTQREFTRATHRIRGLAARMEAGGDAEMLFSSLVVRAFSGKLSTSEMAC
jgi:type I restriction enzyme S subunit